MTCSNCFSIEPTDSGDISMKKVSLLFLLLSAFQSQAALNLDPVLKKVKEHTCETALISAQKPMLIVVGLGNFGYEGTRHNVGDEILKRMVTGVQAQSEVLPEHWLQYEASNDEDAERYMQFSGASSPRRHGLTIDYRVGGRVSIASAESVFSNIVFTQPYYDINESGYFVSQLAKDLGVSPEQIVVIVDDISLARNQVVLSVGKPDGSGDGHNGLKSINTLLGSGAYYRLRVGISNPKAEKVDISRVDWVLGPLPAADLEVLSSDSRMKEIGSLLLNFQQRLNPQAHKQKLVGEGSAILKRINEN